VRKLQAQALRIVLGLLEDDDPHRNFGGHFRLGCGVDRVSSKGGRRKPQGSAINSR
jgi:hypothetical protein